MDLCATIAKEERRYKNANDSRSNPERLEMAESVLAKFLSDARLSVTQHTEDKSGA